MTGQRLFTGATVSDTIAAVLTREPADPPPAADGLVLVRTRPLGW